MSTYIQSRRAFLQHVCGVRKKGYCHEFLIYFLSFFRSVETKNKETLLQGLDLFVEGWLFFFFSIFIGHFIDSYIFLDEVLSGENAYHCEICDKKVKFKKFKNSRAILNYLISPG